jgi:hypothetical protein
MARRLAAIVLMEPALNANYQAAKESCYPIEKSGKSFLKIRDYPGKIS